MTSFGLLLCTKTLYMPSLVLAQCAIRCHVECLCVRAREREKSTQMLSIPILHGGCVARILPILPLILLELRTFFWIFFLYSIWTVLVNVYSCVHAARVRNTKNIQARFFFFALLYFIFLSWSRAAISNMKCTNNFHFRWRKNVWHWSGNNKFKKPSSLRRDLDEGKGR